MKTSKKILLIISGILLVCTISYGFAYSLNILFAISFWAIFILTSLIQLIVPKIWDKYSTDKQLLEYAQEYASKPFQEYEIDVACTYCGKSNILAVDLNNTTFDCSTCNRQNALYINFIPAAITKPLQLTV